MTVVRVLHVVTPAAPGCGEAMLRLLGLTRRALPEIDQRVLLLGTPGDSRAALASGMGDHRRLTPIIGAPRFSARTIRSAIASQRPDLIHVWDAESGAIVIEGRPSAAVAATLGGLPHRRGPRPLSQDRAEALCLRERARRQALAAGCLHDRVHTVLPPSDLAFPEPRMERAAQREAWGFDEDTLAVGVVGDPWSAIDGKLAFDMAGRAWLAGHRVRLVVDPRVAAAAELRRWADLTGLREIFVEDAAIARSWAVLDALDAVLLPEASERPGARSGMMLRRPHGAPSSELSLLWALDRGIAALSTRHGPLDGDATLGHIVTVDAKANDGARALVELDQRRSSGDRASLHRQSVQEGPRSALGWATQVKGLYARAAFSAGLPREVASSVDAAR